MPCVCRKPNSRYWMAKFRDATGRVVMRSTKQTAHREALKLALLWEDATIAARRGELTQAASVKILRDLMEQTTREPFTDAEVTQLLGAAVGADWLGAILVGVWSGLRLADVASLTWGQFDFATGILTARPAKTDKPIKQPMAAELRDYLSTLPPGV